MVTPRLRHSLLVAAIFIATLTATPARAQSGTTLTPDRLTYVVNKDVGPERWTIDLNFATSDPPRAINVTGNVYRSDGAPPSFVWCQIRDDSTGTLGDPSSLFRLRCSGTSACDDTATACARGRWQTIADSIEIPASFFLPSRGANAIAPRATPDVGGTAGVAPRGATLPPDGYNFLVNKELGGLRWSISLNEIPARVGEATVASCSDQTECNLADGLLINRFLNVTGNVYPSDGSAPQFVWCQERKDSAGALEHPESTFRFGCVGASPCQKTASECAAQDWRPIPGGDDVQIPASFFLPPGGLPAAPASDADIVIIGRTSDPPSLIGTLGAGATASSEGVVQGSCSVGASCTLPIGSCGAVPGHVVSDPRLGCGCRVDDVPAECILCGGAATGSCGGDCQYQVGGATARGQCLPFSSTNPDCACYAADENDAVAISICGGSLGATCPAGKCCADDGRDGCNPAQGDLDCAGICVDANGCDPTSSQCGSCLDQRSLAGPTCNGLPAPPGASCCNGCADGTTGCYCDAGLSCVPDTNAICCPTSLPDLCEDYCIPSGADCCALLPDGSGVEYCTAGSVCTPDPAFCCPADQAISCGDDCLAEGESCCRDRTHCDVGFLCTADSKCVPNGIDDCGNGKFCEAGYRCVDDDPGCCRTDLSCGPSCLSDDQACCGDGKFCERGLVCATGGGGDSCCPPDLPDLCGDQCIPAGAGCCPDGTNCDPGEICTPSNQCIPANGAAPADTGAKPARRSAAQAAASKTRVATTAHRTSTSSTGDGAAEQRALRRGAIPAKAGAAHQHLHSAMRGR